MVQKCNSGRLNGRAGKPVARECVMVVTCRQGLVVREFFLQVEATCQLPQQNFVHSVMRDVGGG
jgi:hypothetical protein